MNGLPLILACCVAGPCLAQSVSFESVRLAEILVEGTQQSMDQALPIVVAGMEAELRKRGATERATLVLSQELRGVFTRENVTKDMATFLSQRLSPAEAKDLAAFLQSSLGRKYVQLSKAASDGTSLSRRLIEQACEAAIGKLDREDSKGLAGMCPGS